MSSETQTFTAPSTLQPRPVTNATHQASALFWLKPEAEMLSNLQSAAARITAEHGSRQEARAALAAWIRANPPPPEELVEVVADALVGRHRHLLNREIDRYGTTRVHPKGQETVKRTDQNAVRAVARRVGRSSILLEFMAGKRLGECTRDDLLDDALRNRKQGAGSLEKALFQEYVAFKLREGETVADRLSEPKLQQLRLAARQEVQRQMLLAEEEKASA